jgi:hypothetical protein
MIEPERKKYIDFSPTITQNLDWKKVWSIILLPFTSIAFSEQRKTLIWISL